MTVCGRYTVDRSLEEFFPFAIRTILEEGTFIEGEMEVLLSTILSDDKTSLVDGRCLWKSFSEKIQARWKCGYHRGSRGLCSLDTILDLDRVCRGEC